MTPWDGEPGGLLRWIRTATSYVNDLVREVRRFDERLQKLTAEKQALQSQIFGLQARIVELEAAFNSGRPANGDRRIEIT